MGIYLTSAELELHQWRVWLRQKQANLAIARHKKGPGSKTVIQEHEGYVKWALDRVYAAQSTVNNERARRVRLADSLIGVSEEA